MRNGRIHAEQLRVYRGLYCNTFIHEYYISAIDTDHCNRIINMLLQSRGLPTEIGVESRK